MITDNEVAGMFRLLKDKGYAEVGYEFGLDKKYKNSASMITAVQRATSRVRDNPEKYGISIDTVNDVLTALEHRKTAGLLNRPVEENLTLREKNELLDPKDIKGMVTLGRNKAAKLLNTKLDRISKSKKMLDELDLGKLATVVAIMVDKSQILSGQATENIAVLSKNIDSNLSTEEAIEIALRMREKNMAEKVK